MRVCPVCSHCYDDPVRRCKQKDHPRLSEIRGGSTEMIAGYRLEFLLESDAHGETYRSRHAESGTSCVIRIFPADHVNSKRFLAEAKLAGALFHPNLADVYKAGVQENGTLFVVAEDSECETLRERLKAADAPDLLTTLEIIRQCSEALHVLHLRGLIHRAVRPDNILLSTDHDGRLTVSIQNLDLGGITQHSIVSNKFLIGSALGSLRYFAPEQIDHEAATPQSDIYSLGIVFYEMLAGEPPFSASKAAALIEKHRNQPPPDIRIDDFNLRMLVTHTLMESLQKQPGRRQLSAITLARQLRHIEQLATHVSTPPPAGVIPPAPSRSAPRLSVAIDATRAATIAPSVLRITPDLIKVKDARPIAITGEPESMGVFGAKIDPIHNVILRRSTEDLTRIGDLVPQETIIQSLPKVAPKPRPSRMKLHRKRWHSNQGLAQPTQGKSLSPTGSAEINFAPLAPPSTEITPVQISETLTKVEWAQPEDDIPSIADILAVLSKEEGTDTSRFQEPLDTTFLPAPLAAVGAELERAGAEIPFVEEIVGNRPHDFAVEWDGLSEEDDEITVVTAPGKGIVVEWERPVPEPADFFPEFVPELSPTGAIHTRSGEPIFAAYSSLSEDRFSARRPFAIGVGLLALVALFLFGNASLTSRQTESSSDPISESQSPLPEPLVYSGQPGAERTSKKKATETDGKLAPEQHDKNAPPLRIEQSRRAAPLPDPYVRQTRAISSEIGQSRRPAPLLDPYVRQKVVISSENGKVMSRVEPDKNTGGTKRAVTTNKGAPPTRPRVVRSAPN